MLGGPDPARGPEVAHPWVRLSNWSTPKPLFKKQYV